MTREFGVDCIPPPREFSFHKMILELGLDFEINETTNVRNGLTLLDWNHLLKCDIKLLQLYSLKTFLKKRLFKCVPFASWYSTKWKVLIKVSGKAWARTYEIPHNSSWVATNPLPRLISKRLTFIFFSILVRLAKFCMSMVSER